MFPCIKHSLCIILTLALILQIGAPLCYALGEDSINDGIIASSETGQANSAAAGIESESSYVESIENSESENLEASGTVENTEAGASLQKACDTSIAYELEENRTEYTKDYRLTGGSNAVFLYPVALHEQHEDGQWIEIDNQLKRTESATARTFTPQKTF